MNSFFPLGNQYVFLSLLLNIIDPRFAELVWYGKSLCCVVSRCIKNKETKKRRGGMGEGQGLNPNPNPSREGEREGGREREREGRRKEWRGPRETLTLILMK